LDKGGVLGHDRAHQKGAKKGVDADPLGHKRRCQDKNKDDGQEILAKSAAAFEDEFEAAEEGADEEEHEQDVDKGLGGGEESGSDAGRADDGDDDRQHAPGGDVVDGGAGNGDGADPGFLEVSFGEDSGQDGERGDAHGRAHK